MGAGVCTRTTAMSKAMSEATTQGENMSLGEKALFAFEPLINDTPMVNTSKLNGMLITDHDTYKGYRYWKNEMKGKVYEDFVVLKGIEYDTCDAGHIICIMPEGVKMRLLEMRGTN